MSTLEEFKRKLNTCLDTISFPNPGDNVTPPTDYERDPLRPNEPDGQLEKEGHNVRKSLYVGSTVVGSLLLGFIFIYFIVGFGLNTWNGDGLKTLYWYFGGKSENGVQSKPSIVEILIVSFLLISYIISSVFLIIYGSDMTEKEKQYYKEIREPYNKESLFGKEECVIARDNNMSDPVIAITVISVIAFFSSFFIFIDQVDSFDITTNLTVWTTLSFITFCIGVGFLVSVINIKKYSEGDNEYKCDKYFF